MILDKTLKSLRVSVKTGGTIISHRPVFSHDTKSLYVISANTILVYSTATCLCTGRIRTPNADAVANISLSPLNSDIPESLVILTIGGILYQIDTSSPDCDVLLEANLNKFLHHQWIPITRWLNLQWLKKDTFIVSGVPEHSESALLYILTRNEIDEDSKVEFELEKICWNIIHQSHSIGFGAGGDLVAAIQDDSVFMMNILDKTNRWHLSGTRKFTCVACHPEEWIVATGDDSGRILLWRNFLEEKSPSKTVFHWHTLPVNDLCFTVDGSQMLSGAGECTLVKWDITHTNNKRTLPRMGLPIRHISHSRANAFIATSHADNCIQLVNAQNNIVGSIQNITQCYIPESSVDKNTTSASLGGSSIFKAGLHLDPRLNSMVMNGKPGHLQCYSFQEDRHLYTLDITQQNFITAERQKAIPNSDISHMAFSNEGRWLATGESLIDSPSGNCLELRLKFWKFEETKQIFVLNTTIHWPHEKGMVDLKIQPINDKDVSVLGATSGVDKKFKTWGIVSYNSLHGKEEWWSCENVGTYHDLPAGPLAFSRDGSVLCAAFGHVLTLWTCDNHQMSGSLCHSKLLENIEMIEFGYHMSSNLAICATKTNLLVWNVITSTLMWAVPFRASSICVDPLSYIVAAFSIKNNVYFFRPESPEPLAQHKDISRSAVLSSLFMPNSTKSGLNSLKSTLVFVNSSQELCCMLPKKVLDKSSEIIRVKSNNPSSALTPFAQLIAEKSVADTRNLEANNPQRTKLGLPENQVIREIMDASPHTMPSVTFFCTQLLNAVGTPRVPSEKLEVEDYVINSFKKEGKSTNRKSKNKMEEGALLEPEVSKKQIDAPKKTLVLNLDEIANEDISWIRSVYDSVNDNLLV